jgi:predicted DNA-binding protein
MPSNEPKKNRPVSVRLPLEVFERLKARADVQRRSLSNYLLLLIERDIATEERHDALARIERTAAYTGLDGPPNPVQPTLRVAEKTDESGNGYAPRATDASPGTSSPSNSSKGVA